MIISCNSYIRLKDKQFLEIFPSIPEAVQSRDIPYSQ